MMARHAVACLQVFRDRNTQKLECVFRRSTLGGMKINCVFTRHPTGSGLTIKSLVHMIKYSINALENGVKKRKENLPQTNQLYKTIH